MTVGAGHRDDDTTARIAAAQRDAETGDAGAVSEVLGEILVVVDRSGAQRAFDWRLAGHLGPARVRRRGCRHLDHRSIGPGTCGEDRFLGYRHGPLGLATDPTAAWCRRGWRGA